MQTLELYVEILSCTLLLISLAFLLGIIWRVEMKLDLSYKLFFAAVVALLFSRIAGMLPDDASWVGSDESALQLVFSVLFFGGVFTMRSLLRDVGEK